MLKVIDEGVQITLTGKAKDPLFMLSFVLLGVAILVGVSAMMLPTKATLSIFFVFAVLVFGFNAYKRRLATQTFIATGSLTVKNRHFIGGAHAIKLSENAKIDIVGESLVIDDLGRKWHLSGFDDVKEIHVAKSVLEGKALEKQERAIRML